MTEGVSIDASYKGSTWEVPQYPWDGDMARLMGTREAERHLEVGAMEYVPDDQIESVLEDAVIHPWVVVNQGKDKWRACHDYSVGTNLTAASAPFGLPTVWDLRKVVKPGSFMVKNDLRDGFFAVPVEAGSRKHLVVRHPATGRLMWASRLPFGYINSPRAFCAVTESLAEELRKRLANAGVAAHVFVFVDDVLCIGDTYEEAQRADEMLEQLLVEFGFEWAPHKKRGPAKVMEFLGFLVCNVEGKRCIALTSEKQKKIEEMVADWLRRRPRVG